MYTSGIRSFAWSESIIMWLKFEIDQLVCGNWFFVSFSKLRPVTCIYLNLKYRSFDCFRFFTDIETIGRSAKILNSRGLSWTSVWVENRVFEGSPLKAVVSNYLNYVRVCTHDDTTLATDADSQCHVILFSSRSWFYSGTETRLTGNRTF